MEELTSPTANIGEESPCSPAMEAMTSPSTSFLPPTDINNGIEAETPSSTLAEAATPAMEDAGTPPTEAASPAEDDEHPHAACNGQTSVAMVEDNCEDQGPLGLLVHIDMKGGPPRPQYLVQLLPLLKQWGATGLLIEWEDMFPWEVTTLDFIFIDNDCLRRESSLFLLETIIGPAMKLANSSPLRLIWSCR